MADQNIKFAIVALDQATAPLKSVRNQTEKLSRTLQSGSAAMTGYNRQVAGMRSPMSQASRMVGVFGIQAGDMVVQMVNGTDAIRAFSMQAPQLLGYFGALGAVAGLAAVSFGGYAMAVGDVGKALTNLAPLLGQLQVPFSTIKTVIEAIGAVLLPVANFVVNSFDTMIIAAGLLAARFVLLRTAAIASSAVLSAKAAIMQYVALQTALAGRALTAYEAVMVTARGATIALGGALSAVGKVLMRFLPTALLIGIAYLIEAFLQLQRGAGGFGEVLKLVKDVFNAFLDRTVAQMQRIGLQMQNVGNSIRAMFYAMMEMVTRFITEKTNDLVDGVNVILEKFNLKPVERFTGAMADGFAEATASAQASIIAVDAQIAILGDRISGANQEIRDAFDALKSAYQAGRVEIDLSTLSLEGFGSKGKKALTELEKRTKSIAETFETQMTGALMSMVDGTKSVKDAVKDMARAIIAKLYEVLVVQQIVNAAMGALGFSKNKDGDWTKWTNPFKKRAIGGPVSSGQPYLVGERGPELMIPSGSGRIVPNNQIGSGGNVTVNQSITFGSGVSRAEIQQMLPKIVETTKAAVFDAQRRSVGGRGYA
jgi:hypothetical protein